MAIKKRLQDASKTAASAAETDELHGTAPKTSFIKNLLLNFYSVNQNDISKATDPETGEPLVVYHASGEAFNRFRRRYERDGVASAEEASRINRFGKGIFFSSSPDTASFFGDVVRPFFLKIDTLFEVNLGGADYFSGMLYDPETGEQYLDDDGNPSKVDPDYLPNEMAERHLDDQGKYNTGVFVGGVYERIPSKGHPQPLSDTWIVGNPNQIKSAADNIGTFDSGNSDIRYSAEASQRNLSRPYRLGDVPLRTMVDHLAGIVKGISVEDRNGQLWLKTKSGKEVCVVSVDHIDPDRVALTLGYHYGSAKGGKIAGMYTPAGRNAPSDKTISLVRNTAGLWTLSHEFYHFLEDIGVISNADKATLNQKIEALIRKDPETYAFLKSRSLTERRAEWVGRTLVGIYDAKTTTGRILQKIRNIIDAIVNAFGIRTARGILRDIETGRIYEKGQKNMSETMPASQYSLADDLTAEAIEKASRKIDRAVATLIGKGNAQRVADYATFKEHFKEFWQPFSTVKDGDKVLARRYQSMGNVAKAVRFIQGIQEQLDAFPPEVKKDIFWYLNGDIPLDALPTDARNIAQAIQRRTEIIGEMLVDRGILTEETFRKHQGKYIHYMYAKHIVGDDSPVGITSSGKLDLSYTKRRNPNITMQQRQELGLIEDASVAVPVGMGKALTDIAKFDYLATIADNPDWVWQPSVIRVPIGKRLAKPIRGRTRRYVTMGVGKLVEMVRSYDEMMRVQPTPEVQEIHEILVSALEKAKDISGNVPADFVQLPNTKDYGPLAGAYVRKPIADDLRPVMDINTDRGKLLNTIVSIERQGMAAFKMGKVALNFPTAFRNVISNIIQNNMRGRPLSKIPADLIAAAESLKAKDRYYEEAFGMGIFNTNWFATEINDVLEEFRKAESGRLDKILTALKNVAKYYGKIDDLNKHAIFLQLRKEGKPVDAAALEAMKWGMDYSLTSRSIKGLRQTIMPFATYQYKIAPLIAECLKKRPWVLAKFALIYPAAKMLAMGFHDLDDDDWEDLVKQLPAYIKKSGSMMILPWKTDKGQWQWVNLEYFFPWGNYLAMFRDMREGDSGEFIRDLGISNPFLSMFFTGISAREDQPPIHAYFGTQIYNQLDPAPVKMAKYLEYMANTWMPSMLTRQGALGYTGKMLVGSEDRWGREVTFGQALGRWFGFNIVSVSPEQSRAQVSVRIQELKKEMSRVEADPSRSEEEKAAYRERLNRRLGEIAAAAPAAILPITKAKGHDPAYEALKEMAAKGILHASPPSRSMELHGVPMKMTMDQYAEYLDKSSEIARRKLTALVESPAWNQMTDKRKSDVVDAIVANARKAIRQKIKAQMLRDKREKVMQELEKPRIQKS
ncbi:MAG: hypothetical protein A4E69_01867 [Syntrophus sp. PtaB.Bin138]|nr:MAG: hypothetical protein A4E69_01867 [Syntrophus sp. PtaB.Bin138]